MALRFNDINLPSFVKVNKINVSVLPPIDQAKVQVRGRPGSYDFGNILGERTIKVDVTIIANSQSDLIAKKRQLASWLYYEDAKPLVILAEPDKYYMAKVSGDTDLDSIFSIGKGSITFYCADPYAYSTTEKSIDFNPVDDTPINVTNNGNVATYPRFEFTFTQDTSEFAIISGDEYLYLGQPPLVELPPPEVKRSTIIDDDCSTTTGWTTGSGIDNGVVYGTIESSGTWIRQQNLDYGTGANWHGAAVVKTFSGGKQIQDFTVEVECGFNPGKPNYVGRLEVYVLDQNGNRIGKMAIKNTDTKSENPYVEVRAGTAQSGKTFVNSNVKKGYFSDFLGMMRLQRIGNTWKFLIGKRDSKNRLFNTFSAQYVDVSNSYNTKVAGIMVHFGAYASYAPVLSNYITNIKVYEENVVVQPTAPPVILRSGDKLEVDCSTGTILKNGEPFFSELDPSSNFIRLEPGVNGISIYPQITTNGKIYFTERWL